MKNLFKVFSVFVVVGIIASLSTTPALALGNPQIDSVSPGSGAPVGSNVCIRVSINWDDEYRAMRVRFGSEGWQESSETSFERCFGTGHLSPGTYQIRVEASRKDDNSWSNPNVATQNYELTAGSGGGGGNTSPTKTPSGGSVPYGPNISQISFSPSGGAQVGANVNVHIKVDSNNPGAISLTPSCGNTAHAEHTSPEFDTTWNTSGCGAGEQFIRVCARHKDDPNWTYATCKKGFYQLSSPPSQAPTADFWVDDDSLVQGECTDLRWKTTNAEQVDIDGTVVAKSGSSTVCPGITTRYSLKAVGSGGTATRSLTVTVSTISATDAPDYSRYFSTGDVIQIGSDIFVIVNGQRRLVPNPETLDALGITRSMINNRGLNGTQLATISRGSDIPDVKRDRSGFDAFKSQYFPHTTPIVPASPTPFSQPESVQPSQESESNGGGVSTGQQPLGWDVSPDPYPSATDRVQSWFESVLDFISSEAKAYSEWLPRNDFPDSTECVGFVANTKCRDALYWLDYEAHAYKWVDMASSEKARELGVRVYTTPQPGDIAVWDRGGCGEANSTYGHVAYVSSVNPDGTFNVVESNWSGNHREGRRANVEVLSCMSFIRGGCNVTLPAESPAPPSLSYPWWVPDFAKQFYDEYLRR
ncbi:MAG: seg [candidate division CPR1 bacterium GW2011_GWC1_49_13]|uniref:Seg n=1 Tax=candidate division CPR1 bacterium GW2011_GWC1_49_13 TaxID=1618342 RepID=A0A0G1VIB1_9BACT|nr:MAG: seg [candidate division CPR1 bacterium GW2011_GWC1_49_13]